MKHVEGTETDREDVASAIGLNPRDWEKLKNGCHLDLLTMKFNPRSAEPDGKQSTENDGARANQWIGGVIDNKEIALGNEKWRDKKNQPWRAEEGKDG